jgi:hypothetical protein
VEALLSRDLVNTMGLSCEENLEREANAMMRDWKRSEESYLCRRTVLRGLVELASLGSSIIWLRRACRSSSKLPLPITYKGHSREVEH